MEGLSKSELYLMKQKIEKMLKSNDSVDDLKINVFVKKERKLENNKFLFLFQDTEFLLARNLSSGACKVIMLFRAICKYENKVDYTVKQIIKVSGLSRPTVFKALKELKEKGIILEMKDTEDERRNVYFLNPESQWKGKVANINNVKALFDTDGKFEAFHTSTNPNQLTIMDQIESQNRENDGEE